MPIVRQLFTRTQQVRTAYRDVARLREIVAILIKHGFGTLLGDMDIPGVGLIKPKEVSTELAAVQQPGPDRALAVINELGPTFVKLGQILSTRPNLIPPSYAKAFQQLQDNVDPITFDEVQAQLVKNLGDDALSRFESIHPEALASASIAQVHRATLASGDEVVIKVQRPGVRATLLRDLEVLRFLARQVEYNFPEAKLFNPVGIIGEIERSVRAECDFRTEANHLRRFERNFEGNPHIHIPALYPELSTEEILTEAFIAGVKITEAEAAGHDIRALGQHYLDAAYQMLFKDGFFHGDLHPGNVLVEESGRLAFIDFGMVGRLTPDMRDNCVEMVFALLREDLRTTARIFWDIGIKDEQVSYQSFEAQVFEVMERYFVGTTTDDLAIGEFFAEITDGAVRHRIKMPTSYTMMFKAMVTTEGLVKMIAPGLDPVEFARPHVEQLIAERYSSERLEKEAFFYLGSLNRIVRRLPVALGELLTDMESHNLRFGVDLRPSGKLIDEMRRAQTRRLVMAMSVTSVVCGTLLVPHLPRVFVGLPAWTLVAWGASMLGFAWLLLGYPTDKA